MKRRPPKRQCGVALLTVLLVVFLAALTAASLAELQQLAIRRHTLLAHQRQARLYTLGGEQWAALILRRDRKDNPIDHLGEAWATLKPVLEVEGGVLSGAIADQQSLFNLNNLVDQDGKRDPNMVAVLQRLLELLELDPALAGAILDWIDPDQEQTDPGGAEDSIYLVQTPPYLAANRPFQNRSELRLVRGFDAASYAKLAPYVTALPQGTRLNVNTAPTLLLAALSRRLDPGELEGALAQRRRRGFTTLQEFLGAAKLADPVIRDQNLLPNYLDVASQYFRVRIEAQVGDGRALLTSLLARDPESGNVRVLWRAYADEE
ncbi:MAG TPA: type II secretion system minor pseudopilin GspK [Candidatus Competibacteraceae bacterium]|nr:type II secretion system minor pseudopilin GspK [Candidatus Competibacteraceae bacterium]